MYLLDTNHCSRILQQDQVIRAKLKAIAAVRVVTSVIVRGELVFMARNSTMQVENLSTVEQFFSAIEVLPIDKESADIYGQIKAQLFSKFGPKEKAKRRHYKMKDLGISDNDLWLASVAKRHNLTIVSQDDDFRRIKEAVSDLSIEAWLKH